MQNDFKKNISKYGGKIISNLESEAQSNYINQSKESKNNDIFNTLGFKPLPLPRGPLTRKLPEQWFAILPSNLHTKTIVWHFQKKSLWALLQVSEARFSGIFKALWGILSHSPGQGTTVPEVPH